MSIKANLPPETLKDIERLITAAECDRDAEDHCCSVGHPNRDELLKKYSKLMVELWNSEVYEDLQLASKMESV